MEDVSQLEESDGVCVSGTQRTGNEESRHVDEVLLRGLPSKQAFVLSVSQKGQRDYRAR